MIGGVDQSKNSGSFMIEKTLKLTYPHYMVHISFTLVQIDVWKNVKFVVELNDLVLESDIK